jgi:hypothetical protein
LSQGSPKHQWKNNAFEYHTNYCEYKYMKFKSMDQHWKYAKRNALYRYDANARTQSAAAEHKHVSKN